MKAVQQPWFETQRIRDDLYCISEPFYCWENRANLWLIKGRDADLLIDTGRKRQEGGRPAALYRMKPESISHRFVRNLGAPRD